MTPEEYEKFIKFQQSQKSKNTTAKNAEKAKKAQEDLGKMFSSGYLSLLIWPRRPCLDIQARNKTMREEQASASEDGLDTPSSKRTKTSHMVLSDDEVELAKQLTNGSALPSFAEGDDEGGEPQLEEDQGQGQDEVGGQDGDYEEEDGQEDEALPQNHTDEEEEGEPEVPGGEDSEPPGKEKAISILDDNGVLFRL